ncbi:MAG: hypothetical protein RLP02_37500 [Coleofasciculus sp. C2-GNP5-27]
MKKGALRFANAPYDFAVSTDTWVEANWEEFITFADDPTLTSSRFYYDQGYMRIEVY